MYAEDYTSDIFPHGDVEFAIAKYKEKEKDIAISTLADMLGTYTGHLISALHEHGAPIYKIGGRWRIDRTWYEENAATVYKWW